MEIILALNKILERYRNNVDDCYNQIRHEGDKEFFIEKEMKEYLDSLNLKNKIKVESAYSSCSLEIDILEVCFIYKDELYLYSKKLMLC